MRLSSFMKRLGLRASSRSSHSASVSSSLPKQCMYDQAKVYDFGEPLPAPISVEKSRIRFHASSISSPLILDEAKENVIVRSLVGRKGIGPVVYWMVRDQRVHDNWALLYTDELQRRIQQSEHPAHPIYVVFCLRSVYMATTWRHTSFLLEGLKHVEESCCRLGVEFVLLLGPASSVLVPFLERLQASVVVTDHAPMSADVEQLRSIRDQLQRMHAAASSSSSCSSFSGIHLFEVDAHNIVPVWVASDKRELAARTLRPKIHKLVRTYLTEFPQLPSKTAAAATATEGGKERAAVDWVKVHAFVTAAVDMTVPSVNDRFRPGETAAFERLRGFLVQHLPQYADSRNDPNSGVCSGLSPYITAGHLSAQRIMLEAIKAFPRIPHMHTCLRESEINLNTAIKGAQQTDGSMDVGGIAASIQMQRGISSFLEELLVRKELSDNYVFYSSMSPSLPAFPRASVTYAPLWAQETLLAHAKDPRPYLYSAQQLDDNSTHDELWNSAQLSLRYFGKMHGYLRMYWAKKILEWTRSPCEALEICQRLNDRYSLDGNCPNGIAGVHWSILGTHDMGWRERPVFGKVRYMNLTGCKRKFDVDKYVAYVRSECQNNKI